MYFANWNKLFVNNYSYLTHVSQSVVETAGYFQC